MSDSNRANRRRRRLKLALGGFVIVLIILRVFFFQLHRIQGASMWPSYVREAGPEWVIVARGRLPGVYEPIVVRDPEKDDGAVLKRLIAVGTSEVQPVVTIVDGDVRVDSRPLERSIEQILSTAVPLFRLNDVKLVDREGRGILVDRLGARVFVPLADAQCGISDDGKSLRLVSAKGQSAELRCPEADFHDDHQTRSGKLVAGDRIVRDLIVTFSVHKFQSGASLRLEHWLGEGKEPHVSLTLEAGSRQLDVSIRGGRLENERQLGLMERHRFSRIDGLVFRMILVDERRVLQYRDRNGSDEFETLFEADRKALSGTTESYLKLVSGSGSVTLSRLDIARDIHYTPTPADGHGVESGCVVTDGSVFILGDNSPESRDSRNWGLIDREDVIGRPTLVLWPWK